MQDIKIIIVLSKFAFFLGVGMFYSLCQMLILSSQVGRSMCKVLEMYVYGNRDFCVWYWGM